MKLPKFEVVKKDGWILCTVPCLPLGIDITKGYYEESNRWIVSDKNYIFINKKFNKLERAVEFAVKEAMRDLKLEIADLQNDLNEIKKAIQENTNE